MKMVPFKNSMLKQMGVVKTPKGLMIDSSKLNDKQKLADKKKFAKPESPEIKQVNKEIKMQSEAKPRITISEKQRRENRGIY